MLDIGGPFSGPPYVGWGHGHSPHLHLGGLPSILRAHLQQEGRSVLADTEARTKPERFWPDFLLLTRQPRSWALEVGEVRRGGLRRAEGQQ